MPRAEHTDADLVRQLRRGDEEAFEHFFEEYFDRLYRFALPRMANNEDAAEEVVQATLCKAITKLGTFRARAPLFSWLCTFCRHEISRYLGRSGRKSPVLYDDLPRVRRVLEQLWVDTTSPDEQLMDQEAARQVHVVLDHLPRSYSSVLRWKYVDGLRLKQIAQRLGLGEKAAESLLTRSRAAFRKGFLAMLGLEGPTSRRTP